MRREQSSQTAAYVAAWRAFGDYLPPEVALCHDSLGWCFVPPLVGRLRPLADRFPGAAGRVLLATPLRRLLLWMQLRTRAIDDIVLDFARRGGRQVVVLGAGFDVRAVRLASGLGGAKVFEIDHPSTQERKRRILATAGVDAGAKLLPWDFERDPVAELPGRLVARGLEPARATLTIWEGVIPYLTESAVAATLSAVRALGSERSQVILHYIEKRRIESHTPWHFAATWFGEPLRFGWDPAELPGWLARRQFALESDRDDETLAAELFPQGWAGRFRFDGAGGRIAVARPELSTATSE